MTIKIIGQFDILISNPPYSVEAFKSTLKNGKETFELYNNLTDNSSEIECLFVERMKQLLKVGGWAGVVLPVSILTNSGIYTRAREIIFKYFKVKSIVELGSGTFMKTGTNTIILFLERRADNEYKEIEIAIDKFFNDTLDITVVGIENAFSKFVSNVYENLSFDDYIKIIKGKSIKHELYVDYKKEFDGNIEYIKKIEKEKMLYFLLTCNQDTVIIKTGKKQEEKNFLGYEFSERRGHEGLKWLPHGTKLYNEKNALDKTKANSYIYNAFKGIKNQVDKSLEKNISYKYMSSLFEYGTSRFDKKVNLNKYNPIKSYKNYPLIAIKDYIRDLKIINGYAFKSKDFRDIKENVDYLPVLKIANIKGKNVDLTNTQYHFSNSFESYIANPKSLAISLTGGNNGLGRVGKVAWLNEKALVNQRVLVLEGDYSKLEYLYANIDTIEFLDYVLANSSGSSQKNISADDLLNYKIPLPSNEIQQKIISEIEKKEDKHNLLLKEIQKYIDKIENIFYEDRIIITSKKEKLRTLVKTNPSKAELNAYDKNILVSFVEMSSVSNDGYIVNRVDKKLSDVRSGSYTYFKKNDIIIAKITPCMENGKCAIASGLTNGIGMGSSEFHVLRCSDKINNKYLFTYLNRNVIRKEAEKNMTGASGHRRVPITFYENLEIPVISMDKQKEIVAEIENYEKIILDTQNEINKLNDEKKNILEKYLK